MLTKQDIQYRAMMMGIKTGEMPDPKMIWALQRAEGYHECFGHGLGCPNRHCRWRQQCLALDFYADEPLPIAAESSRANTPSRSTETNTPTGKRPEQQPVSPQSEAERIESVRKHLEDFFQKEDDTKTPLSK